MNYKIKTCYSTVSTVIKNGYADYEYHIVNNHMINSLLSEFTTKKLIKLQNCAMKRGFNGSTRVPSVTLDSEYGSLSTIYDNNICCMLIRLKVNKLLNCARKHG